MKLIDWSLGTHAAILAVVIVAYYVYGEKSNMLIGTRQTTEDMLRGLRRLITLELEATLSPVFSDLGSVVSLIVRPNGGDYIERAVSPLQSEEYRETVRSFIESSADRISDYRTLRMAINSWSGWIRARAWCLLVLLTWQALLVAILGLGGKLFSITIGRCAITASFCVTTLMIVSVLVESGVVRVLDHRIGRIHDTYGTAI